MANAPAFKEAHELNVTASVKFQDNSWPAPNADVAYSVTKNFAVLGSYRSMINKPGYLYPVYDKPENYSVYDREVRINGNRFEAGVGYYLNYRKDNLFEIFGGYGYGNISSPSYGNIPDVFSSSYQRFFLQPAIGSRYKSFSVIVGAKFVVQQYANFKSFDSALVYQINTRHYDPPSDFRGQRFLFVEPFLDMGAGYKGLLFKWQIGFSAQCDGNATILGDLPIYAGVGVTWYIRLKKKAEVDTLR